MEIAFIVGYGIQKKPSCGSGSGNVEKTTHIGYSRRHVYNPIIQSKIHRIVAVKKSDSDFEDLQREIIRCRKCPRLVEWRERVAREKVRRFRDQEYWGRPAPAFGSPDAGLMVIGLAPAAHGGNRTGRMFTGDGSGDWLYEALYRYGFANRPESVSMDDGLMLHNCLITAVARCAPPKNRLTAVEIENCRDYLKKELELARDKKIVLVLGQVAFQVFVRLWRESDQLPNELKPKFRHGGVWVLPGGLHLLSCYHPSRQNTQTGKLTRLMFHDVFDRARAILDAAS
ncbi:MAG: uracil-DNA glycosylase [Acidobacteria bacterium]|nr:uracil-DNA glycosylase [Acidobacteriota bacterium]